MIRKIQVIKKPRSDVLKAKPIAFPPLANLHLELLEVKKKLKQGLPTVMVIPRKPPAPPKKEPKKKEHQEAVEELKDLQSPEVSDDETPEGEESPEEKSATSEGRTDDKDMVDELGVESEGEGEEDVEENEEESGDEGDAVEESESEEEAAGENEEEQEASNDPYAGMTQEERDHMEHEEYIWRFRILKKKYPTADMPDFNEHSDLRIMKTSYERKIRELTLDDNVSSYRMFLYAAFNGIEYAATQLIGFDMGGFTQHQKKMMHKYDRLLVELGERSYSTWGSSLPIEVRLLGMVLFQACVFYLGKVVADKMGDNVKDMFDGMMGVEEKGEKESPEGKPKPKMKGPSVNLDDIKKMEEEDKED